MNYKSLCTHCINLLKKIEDGLTLHPFQQKKSSGDEADAENSESDTDAENRDTMTDEELIQRIKAFNELDNKSIQNEIDYFYMIQKRDVSELLALLNNGYITSDSMDENDFENSNINVVLKCAKNGLAMKLVSHQKILQHIQLLENNSNHDLANRMEFEMKSIDLNSINVINLDIIEKTLLQKRAIAVLNRNVTYCLPSVFIKRSNSEEENVLDELPFLKTRAVTLDLPSEEELPFLKPRAG